MKNSITDLSETLFEQLSRLNKPGISDKELKKEINRSNAVAKVSSEIIKAGTLQYKAVRLALENKSIFKPESLPMITDENKNLINAPKLASNRADH